MDEPSEFRQTFDDKNLPAESAQFRRWILAQGLVSTIESLKSRSVGKQQAWNLIRLYFPQSFREFSAAWDCRQQFE
jgi:hypothetical protein